MIIQLNKLKFFENEKNAIIENILAQLRQKYNQDLLLIGKNNLFGDTFKKVKDIVFNTIPIDMGIRNTDLECIFQNLPGGYAVTNVRAALLSLKEDGLISNEDGFIKKNRYIKGRIND